MKKYFYLSFLIVGLLCACTEDNNEQSSNSNNKVVLLKVDFLTNTFEGGKEISFDSNANFTISHDYNPPGDFGDIQLYYQELDELIFDGTIVWMGLGLRSFPSSLMGPNDFSQTSTGLPLPDTTLFENLMYDTYAYYPDSINHQSIWNAIGQLEIVSEYRISNPSEPIHLFLYTPSVGVGDPADWDWYIILKN